MGCCTEKPDKLDPAKLDLVWERKPKLAMGRREMIVGSAGLAGLAMAPRAQGAGDGEARLLQPAPLRGALRVHPRAAASSRRRG